MRGAAVGDAVLGAADVRIIRRDLLRVVGQRVAKDGLQQRLFAIDKSSGRHGFLSCKFDGF
jgi:hypothetical protein